MVVGIKLYTYHPINQYLPERSSGSFELHPSLDERRPGTLPRRLETRRVFKPFMNALSVARKCRTAFLCVVADCEHVIERLALELINMLRAMTGNINAKLFHNCNGFRSDAPRYCASAFNFEAVARIMLEQPFSHLAAYRIPRTEN